MASIGVVFPWPNVSHMFESQQKHIENEKYIQGGPKK